MNEPAVSHVYTTESSTDQRSPKMPRGQSIDNMAKNVEVKRRKSFYQGIQIRHSLDLSRRFEWEDKNEEKLLF